MSTPNINALKEIVAQKIQVGAYLQACDELEIDATSPRLDKHDAINARIKELVAEHPHKFLFDASKKIKQDDFDTKTWAECCSDLGITGYVKKDHKKYEDVKALYRDRKGIPAIKEKGKEDTARLGLWTEAVRLEGLSGIITKLHPRYESVKRRFVELREASRERDP